VPVEDKCASCDADHIDLSQQAFAELAPLSVGVVNGITWKFVESQVLVVGAAVDGDDAPAAGREGREGRDRGRADAPRRTRDERDAILRRAHVSFLRFRPICPLSSAAWPPDAAGCP